MQWFVVGWMVTVLWGNGAVEEARTNWSDVYFGTSAECQSLAANFRVSEEKRSERVMSDPYMLTAKHGQNPTKWNGGIKNLQVGSAFCAPFASAAAIKATFPEGWVGMPGSRGTKNGGREPFKWWDGPDGATIR